MWETALALAGIFFGFAGASVYSVVHKVTEDPAEMKYAAVWMYGMKHGRGLGGWLLALWGFGFFGVLSLFVLLILEQGCLMSLLGIVPAGLAYIPKNVIGLFPTMVASVVLTPVLTIAAWTLYVTA